MQVLFIAEPENNCPPIYPVGTRFVCDDIQFRCIGACRITEHVAGKMYRAVPENKEAALITGIMYVWHDAIDVIGSCLIDKITGALVEAAS